MKSIAADKWPRPRRFNGHWCYWFWNDTFRENVHLIWPVNEAQRRAFINDRATEPVDFTCADGPHADRWNGRTTEFLGPAGAQVIALRYWKNDDRGNGVLAHEIFHAVNNILSTRGVEFDNSVDTTNEPYAYLIESLFRTCYQALTLTRSKMPLRKGKRAKTKKGFSANVKTLVDDFKRKGKIGTSRPRSKAKAIKQAVAISFALKRGGKKRRGGKRQGD